MSAQNSQPLAPTTFSRHPSDIKSALTLYDLRQKAIKYYSTNDCLQRIENGLNSMFYDNPPDVYGYLSAYFEEWCREATITRIRARQSLDSRGQAALTVDVFGIVKNKEVPLVSGITYPNPVQVYDHAKPEEFEVEENTRLASIEKAIGFVNGEFSDVLRGHSLPSPFKIASSPQGRLSILEELDDLITRAFDRLTSDEQRSLDRSRAQTATGRVSAAEDTGKGRNKSGGGKTPDKKGAGKGKGKASGGGKGGGPVAVAAEELAEVLPVGAIALGAASAALSLTCASLAQIPLYDYVASIRYPNFKNGAKLRMPLPVFSLISNGKAGLGKQFLGREYLLMPRLPFMGAPDDYDLENAVRDGLAVYQRLSRNLIAKLGLAVRNGNETGALCPLLDKTEVGIEMVNEALSQLEYSERFGILINCAAHEIFDYDKGKYEILSGTFKSGEELVDIYAEMVTKLGVIGLVDPFRRADRENWTALSERLSGQAWLVSSQQYAEQSAKRLLEEHTTQVERERAKIEAQREKRRKEVEAAAAAEAARLTVQKEGTQSSSSEATERSREKKGGPVKDKERDKKKDEDRPASTGEDGEATEEEPPDTILSLSVTNVASLRFEHRNTFSDLLRLASLLEDKMGNAIMVETQRGESTDSYDVDFAVGVQASFIKIGAPSRGERISKLNRLLSIFSELQVAGRVLPFPPPPTPPASSKGSRPTTGGSQAKVPAQLSAAVSVTQETVDPSLVPLDALVAPLIAPRKARFFDIRTEREQAFAKIEAEFATPENTEGVQGEGERSSRKVRRSDSINSGAQSPRSRSGSGDTTGSRKITKP